MRPFWAQEIDSVEYTYEIDKFTQFTVSTKRPTGDIFLSLSGFTQPTEGYGVEGDAFTLTMEIEIR